MESYFTVSTETYAEKAQRLLSRYRYPFRLTKTTGPEGCAYRFRVTAAADDIFPLLRASGIPFTPLRQ